MVRIPFVGVSLAAAVGVQWLARRCCVVVTVEGESMLPALRPGDKVLTVRVPASRLRGGDIVVVKTKKRDVGIIKRVAVVAGERAAPEMLPEGTSLTVPEGRLVLLGGNTARSTDSRRVGFYRTDQVVGRVTHRLVTGPRQKN